jgi:F-type H+-transporting ATPase subunit delta
VCFRGLDMTHAELAHEIGTATEQQVARVYATALLNEAWKRIRGQETLEELEGLLQLLQDRPDFAAYLNDPSVSRETRAGLLHKAFDGRISDLVVDFLMILNEHDRLGNLFPTVRAFRQMYEERQNRQRVQVRSAKPLAEEQMNRLLGELRQFMSREPVLETRIDPELIGGFVVKVGDWLYDASVRTQLQAIRNRVTERSSYEIQSGRDRFSH